MSNINDSFTRYNWNDHNIENFNLFWTGELQQALFDDFYIFLNSKNISKAADTLLESATACMNRKQNPNSAYIHTGRILGLIRIVTI